VRCRGRRLQGRYRQRCCWPSAGASGSGVLRGKSRVRADLFHLAVRSGCAALVALRLSVAPGLAVRRRGAIQMIDAAGRCHARQMHVDWKIRGAKIQWEAGWSGALLAAVWAPMGSRAPDRSDTNAVDRLAPALLHTYCLSLDNQVWSCMSGAMRENNMHLPEGLAAPGRARA